MRIVLTTVGSREAATQIGRTLLEDQLAACVTMLPAESMYWWDGEIHSADETLLIIKTAHSRMADLEKRLREIHPYELPEFVALAPDAVLPEYAAWVRQSCGL
jgi:periplasmic divalent cation tolerance protein